MTEHRTQRRLAAVLCADVAGFSRMVQVDEDGTLAALRARRAGVVEPVLAAHAGRVVKHMGDGFLAEFASAVNAVSAALDLQERMATANAGLPPDRQIALRIGINLGDIVGEGDDIFGDGVNIAARLEPLAEPGGIVVSAKVRDEAAGKTAAQFTDMGNQVLKNMAAPVRAFRVTTGPAAAPPTPQTDDRLSVAVLPFTSLGADPDQQYFGDGVTEDIITELARVPVLRVASRNSSFRFRGPDADLPAAAQALNVRFIVEGSVRRLGPRLRITAQLIDTSTGAHLWAERYDRPAEGIFEVQDEVVRSIAGTLVGRLQGFWLERTTRKPPQDRTALDLAMQAEQMSWHTDGALREARSLARQAVELDGRLARAHAVLALVEHFNWMRDLSVPETQLRAALDHARTAVALDPSDYYCHVAASNIYLSLRMHDLSEKHLERALNLNRDRPGVLSTESHFLVYTGHVAEARLRLEAASRADSSFNPTWLWSSRLIIEYSDRDYAAALRAFQRIDDPADWDHAYAAASHAMLGNAAAARTEAASAIARNPAFTIGAALSREPFRDPADSANLAEGMRRAGLPD